MERIAASANLRRSDGDDRETSGGDCHGLTGVALVADVSGYTSFTESRVALGREGMEGLGRHIDGLFTRCLDLVDGHGGQAVSVAGDALVVCWPAGAGELAGRASAARQCAEALAALGRGADSGEPHLSLHLGLAAGGLWAGRLPALFGASAWLWAGEALRAAFAACRAAGPGTVLAHPSLQEAARPGGAARDSGPPAAVLPMFLTVPVADRESAPAAELRSIASLFIRLPEFDESRAESWSRHRHAISIFHETMGASAATGRVVVDDGGLTLVSVFGEPDGSSAQAPERSVHAAAGIVRRFEEAGFAVAAGLAFGRAFCGRIGRAGQSWQVTLGRPMNLAARLMERAGRGLLVSGLSDLRNAEAPETTDVQRLRMKGFEAPVEVRRVLLPARAREGQTRLFGREYELGRLAVLLDEPRVFLLRGDPGSGKSALISATVERARDRGIQVAIGVARSTERSVPYFPWRSVLRTLLLPAGVKDDRALREALLQRLAGAGLSPELAPLLNVVLPVGFAETARSEGLVGRHRADATVDLICELVTRGDRAPLLVVLEDVHQVDSASLQLIDRLSHRVASIALLMSARPSAETSALLYRLSGPRLEELDVLPLDDAAVAALVRSRLGGPVDDQVVRVVQQASEGNPLFAHEYVVLLRESGRLALGPGPEPGEHRWRLGGGQAPSSGAPDTVLSAIADRIHSLGVNEQHLIKAASVVGDSFSTDVLARIQRAPLAPGTLEGALLSLEHSGLVARTSTQRAEFGFSHAMVREAAYELMLVQQRRELHASVGRILEERHIRDMRGALPLLVHHFAAARDDHRTMKFADTAAAEALQQGAYREAAEFLRLCLEAADRAGAPEEVPDPRVRWHRQLSQASAALGDLAARRASAEAAFRSAGLRVRRSPLRAALLTGGRLLWRGLVRRPAPRPRRVSDRWPLFRELAQAAQQLATSAYFASERVWFGYYATEAVRYAERGGRSSALSYAFASLGGCLGWAGFDRAGRAYLEAAVEVAAQVGDRHAQAWADLVGSLYLVGRGDWPATSMRVARCEEISEQIGDLPTLGNVQAVRFWMRFYVGDDQAAQDTAERLIAHAQRSGNRQHERWGHRYRGLCRFRAGAIEEAAADLEAAQALLTRVDGPNEVAPVLASLAAIRRVTGRMAEACALADETLCLLETRPTSHALLEACSALVEVAVEAWRHTADGSTEERLRRAGKTLAAYSRVFPIGRPRLGLWSGDVALHRGRRRQAQRLWQRARREAEALQMRPELTLLQTRATR